jgi:hypothetical protein
VRSVACVGPVRMGALTVEKYLNAAGLIKTIRKLPSIGYNA